MIPIYNDLRPAFRSFRRSPGLVAVAILALALGIGANTAIYSAATFQVEQTRRAVGIRMALGASPAQTFTVVLGQSLRLVVPGILLGGLLAIAISRFVASLLFGITPLDAFTYCATLGSLLLAAILATLSPAFRAASTDPAGVLREE